MAALRCGRPCLVAAMACQAVLGDRDVDSNATHEDYTASYASSALGAQLASGKFNRRAGEAAPASAGNNLPAGASANVAVAMQIEDADVVGEEEEGATAEGRARPPGGGAGRRAEDLPPAKKAVSSALKAVSAALNELQSDNWKSELAEAAMEAASKLGNDADAPGPEDSGRRRRDYGLYWSATMATEAKRGVSPRKVDDASYAKLALGAHLAPAKFYRSAAEVSANVAVATAGAFEPIKIEDSETTAKVGQAEDSDVVGEARGRATAAGEMEHLEETSPAREAASATLKALERDAGRRELAEAATAAAAPAAAAFRQETNAATEARGSGSPGITDRPGAADPMSLDLQMQRLRRFADKAKQSHDAAAQMLFGQLAQLSEPHSGDARHRSMPLRHPQGVNPTKLVSSGAGVSRGSSGAKTLTTLELPILVSTLQAPAPTPADTAAIYATTPASKNHSAVQLAEQGPPSEHPTGGSNVASSEALDEATLAQPAYAITEATTEEEGSTAGH